MSTAIVSSSPTQGWRCRFVVWGTSAARRHNVANVLAAVAAADAWGFQQR